jgi:hypothetical protein
MTRILALIALAALAPLGCKDSSRPSRTPPPRLATLAEPVMVGGCRPPRSAAARSRP